MRVLVASLMHETNTFSSVPTPLARFGVSATRGFLAADRLHALSGTDTEIAGFTEVLQAAGIDFDVLEPAEALPSGPVSRETFEALAEPLFVAAERGRYAGILLALHGAMVVESHDDAERCVIEGLRARVGAAPIVASFDMHANLSATTVRGLHGFAGYHTYPHVDCAATGRRVARLLVGTLRGELQPTIAFGRRRMLPQVMAQGTYRSPNRELQALAAEWERTGNVLAASLFTGFPHADVPEAGLSAAVVTDGDAAAAERKLAELLDRAWSARAGFVFREEPLATSMARAVAAAGSSAGPIVLLDHCDNTSSGGAMDTTTVLAAIIDARLEQACFYGIRDPEAVAACARAGIGARVTLALGARTPAARDYARSAPLTVRGIVRTLSAGTFARRGPFAAGTTSHLGPIAVLDTGRIRIVILSQHAEPADLEYFYGLGIDPRQCRYIGLKSRVHWRAAFDELRPTVIECSGTGACISDFGKLAFTRIPRPIYPLDEVADTGAIEA